MAIIKIKRGLQANVPTGGYNIGEFLLATDTKNLYICVSQSEKRLIGTHVELGDYLKKSNNLSDLTNKALARQHLNVFSKNEVEARLTGLAWKRSAKVLCNFNRNLQGFGDIDGVTLVANDRVLVMGQDDKTQNGIYKVSAGAWVRDEDANTGQELKSAALFIEKGTEFDNTAWTCISDDISLGASDIEFIQFGGKNTYVAGEGLQLNGNEFAFDVEDFSIQNKISPHDYLIVQQYDSQDNSTTVRAKVEDVVSQSGIESDNFTVKVNDQDNNPGFLAEKLSGISNDQPYGQGISVIPSGDKAYVAFTPQALPEMVEGDFNFENLASIPYMIVRNANKHNKISLNNYLKSATIDGGTF